MFKWIAVIVVLIFLWLSGWRIQSTQGGHAPFFARSGANIFSKFNPSESFDEVTGNKARAERALKQMR